MEKCNLTQVPCRKAIMDVVQANKDRRSLQHTYELAELFRIACSGNEAFMELSEEDQERFWLITDALMMNDPEDLKRVHSIKINRSKYNNHIKPVLGKIKVQKIEKRAVVKLQQDLSKKLSASMTNGVIVLLKTVLNAAVDDEILMKNPAASVKPLRKDDRPKASETIHRALTREEQQAFMQEAKTEWLYEFFCFSLCTGMRLNEITALKWQDIDYINNVIRVNKTVSWKEGGGIEETLPKSDTSNRDIPMNDTIKKILQMQKTKMSMVYGEIHARKMDSNIFIGSNGTKAIASSTVSSAIDNVLKRLRQQGIEIERFTHHAFRDTFATRYIEEGGNMQTLQKILGHSSLAMTADLYAHVLPNTKQQEMQQIENGFIGVAVL